MRVILTGSAGRLGSVALPILRRGGHEVIPADRDVLDLLNEGDTKRLIESVKPDAVIHLANHPGANRGTPQTVLNENVTMNMNVFQSAVDSGARKLVYASSVQVHQGELRTPEQAAENLPFLPIDRYTPISARNPYGLSKVLGERTLEYFSTLRGIEAVSIRFPGLRSLTDRRPFYEEFDADRYPSGSESMAWLWPCLGISREDASRLLLRLLESNLPGYRVYLPAAGIPRGMVPSEFLAKHLPAAAACLRSDSGRVQEFHETMDRLDRHGLCDTAYITEETGWEPEDV
jgi:nucleoside-diphosphate-sugar epimerase